MKTEVETLNPTRVRLSVEVPFDDLKPSVDAAYKRIGESVNIPGFRKGKVPHSLIDQRFGRAAVLEDAVNNALPRIYSRAVEQGELDPIGQPEVEITEVPDPQAGGELKFTAAVDVRPVIEVPDLSAVVVTVEAEPIDDDAVDKQIDALRARFGTVKPVQRPAAKGDFLTIDLAATVDGKDVEELSSRGLSYEIGSGALLEGLDEALTGLSTGESGTFETTLVAGEYAGQKAQVSATAVAVRERELPDLDDDFVQSASEFDTVEQLREDLQVRLGRARTVEQVRQARDKVLEAVLAIVEIPVPESAAQAEVHSRQHTLERQLQAAGLTKQQYLQSEGQSEDDFDNELTDGARDVVRAQLLLDAIVKEQNFDVEQHELTEHLIRRAVDMGVNPQEFAEAVMENNQVPMLMSEIVRAKALAWLVKQATVNDEQGNVIDVDQASQDAASAVATGDVDE